MTQEGKEEADVAPKESKGDVQLKNPEKARRGCAYKIIVRRLPPSMSETEFLEQFSPLPDYESYYFTCADSSMSGNSFARVYISLRSQQDILQFKEKWDGYVFLDERGQEYPAIVEFAPFQKMPRKKPKKADSKCGTLENDAEYLKFLETMDVEEDISLPSMETTVEELEKRDRELKANNGVPNVLTPLIEYVLAKNFRLREEKREEKRKKGMERKEKKRRQKKLFTAAKINKDGVLREESDEDGVVSEEESRSESQRKEKGRTPKAPARTPKNRQSTQNRDRNYDDEPGFSGRQRPGRGPADREGSNRSVKHPDDEPRPQRRSSRGHEAVEAHEEERTSSRREKRAPRNSDRDRISSSATTPTPKDTAGSPNDALEPKPSEASTSKPDRPERREKSSRKERPGEKKPRTPRKEDRPQPKKEVQPKPQSKRYSDIRPGAQERQQQAVGEKQEAPLSNDAEKSLNLIPAKVRNHRQDQRNTKVRNRDRPALEIYRPGQRKKQGSPDDRNTPEAE